MSDIHQAAHMMTWALLFVSFGLGAAPVAAACPARMGWVINAAKARKLHKQGALFLDARKASAFHKGHIKGAIHVKWQQFSRRTLPSVGRLLSARALQKELRAVGVSQRRAVVVYGDPLRGWGEEGRIVWMLRSAGHGCAAFVDGGYQALRSAKLPTSRQPGKAKAGDIVVKRKRRWSTTRQRIQKHLKNKASTRFVDAREKREYNGATPYGELRGGHLPGAVHLHYKKLLNRRGYLRPRSQLRKLLKRAGITRKQRIIAYCTGGIRSAWLVAVLVHLGYPKARNYAGSMWEWAASPAATHPLSR